MISNNSMLRAANFICLTLLILGGVVYVIYVGIILHSFFDPGLYSEIIVNTKPGFSFEVLSAKIDLESGDMQRITGDPLGYLSVPYKCWLLVRSTIFFGLALLILERGRRIFRSIADLHTFHSSNARYFREMAVYTVILFLVSMINFGESPDGSWSVGFTVQLSFLLLGLFFGILSVVFSEGERLMNEQKMIV